MENPAVSPCTAFEGTRRIASGPLVQVALAVKACLERDRAGTVLVFEDETGRVIDLDLRGSEAEVLARLGPSTPPEAPRGRGRPRLGVVPREVTLLPRHWEWLNAQPGGASVALRRLVEEARRSGGFRERRRLAQDRAYRFMSALAGDAPGYEEALRALYAGNASAFEAHTQTWPMDLKAYAGKLAGPVWGPEDAGAPAGEGAR